VRESLGCRTVRLGKALAWSSGLLLSITGCGKTWHAPVEMAEAPSSGAGGSGAPVGSSSGGNAGTPGEVIPGPIASAGAPGTGGTGSVPATVDCSTAGTAPVTIQWNAVNGQQPAWYATAEALSIAENILYYQNANRGWPKNIEMTARTAARDGASTIDNSATTTQIDYLARVYSATGCAKYGDAAVAGIQYLLDAQYPNGGWPQRYPDPEGYPAHITFNDNAMVRVLDLLRAVSRRTDRFAFADEALAALAASAVESGIGCILATQVETDGVKTGWCAQHDEVTLEPAQARTYELPSLSGSEGAGLLRFLMTIEDPSPEVREAVNGAAAWFEQVKLTGIRIERVVDATLPEGEDRVVVEDPAAPPLWARFYELGTNVPIFSSRCEVDECDEDPFFMRRYSLAEIENERRVGYAWYGNWGAQILSTTYPQWKARWGE
jgi:PelA/Pel-15E family pectate lyase